MDRNPVSNTYMIPQAHWDAMADIIGESETVALYGDRPELVNTRESVERLYFADKAPRRSVYVTVALALVAFGSVLFGAWRGAHADKDATIDPCALVLTREQGPVCR